VNKLTLFMLAALLLAACGPSDEAADKDPAATAPQTSAAKKSQDDKQTTTQKKELKPQQTPVNPQVEVEATVPGQKYQIVESQADCNEPVVMEFFAYQCPHCNNLEPAAEAWRAKNASVRFQGVPTDLGNPQMGSLLLVHHTAKILGVLEKTQHALFNRVHKEKKLFASPDEAVAFLVEQGADAEQARKTLDNKEAITRSIEADFELLKKYKITSVPQVLVNHRYMTNISAAGGHKEVFEVVDQTLKLESSCQVK